MYIKGTWQLTGGSVSLRASSKEITRALIQGLINSPETLLTSTNVFILSVKNTEAYFNICLTILKFCEEVQYKSYKKWKILL